MATLNIKSLDKNSVKSEEASTVVVKPTLI